jgi:hypothetical protein
VPVPPGHLRHPESRAPATPDPAGRGSAQVAGQALEVDGERAGGLAGPQASLEAAKPTLAVGEPLGLAADGLLDRGDHARLAGCGVEPLSTGSSRRWRPRRQSRTSAATIAPLPGSS